jgi:hypothetical protein
MNASAANHVRRSAGLAPIVPSEAKSRDYSMRRYERASTIITSNRRSRISPRCSATPQLG